MNVLGTLLRDLRTYYDSPFLRWRDVQGRACWVAREFKEYLAEGRSYEPLMRQTQSYIFNLAAWHIRIAKRLRRWADAFADCRDGQLRVLDFGAGIGTHALLLVGQEIQVVAVELNCSNRAFIRHRKSRLSGRRQARLYVTSELYPNIGLFDDVLLMDVVGHLEHPHQQVKQLGGLLEPEGRFHIKWDLFNETSEGLIHRNKEVDFHSLLAGMGFVKTGHDGEAEVWQRSSCV